MEIISDQISRLQKNKQKGKKKRQTVENKINSGSGTRAQPLLIYWACDSVPRQYRQNLVGSSSGRVKQRHSSFPTLSLFLWVSCRGEIWEGRSEGLVPCWQKKQGRMEEGQRSGSKESVREERVRDRERHQRHQLHRVDTAKDRRPDLPTTDNDSSQKSQKYTCTYVSTPKEYSGLYPQT